MCFVTISIFHAHLWASRFSVTPDRILVSIAEGASDTLASPGYVLLAKEFHVSVDEVASSFTASSLGFALFTYVGPVQPMVHI